MTWALAVACLVAAVPSGLRWLRVAQREHYLAGSATRFAARWWGAGQANRLLLVAGLAGLLGSIWSPVAGLLVPLAQVGPIGLGVRGVTAPLAWTIRLRRLASVVALMVVVLISTGALLGSAPVVVLPVIGLPLLVDAALAVLGPVERALGAKWVDKAARRLEAVGAEVVAITGSYGKTTTKIYTAHLLAGRFRVVASPASFNNRLGLARAVNENLTPGTEVFVAEMGTYGKGEIAELCSWMPPKVAAMVAIGPVHLERFRTEERIVEAKAEILDRAEVGVICIDNPLLAELAHRRASDLQIIEVSTGAPARVVVDGESVIVDGSLVANVPPGSFAANLAVAFGICLAMGVDPAVVSDRVVDLPKSEHRQTVREGEGGFSIVDDTFNSNPAGARRGLEVLAAVSGAGKKAVVTPGMVELGPRQSKENEAFAAAASAMADDLVIVGSTNKQALLRGSAMGRARVTLVESRGEAVAWVRDNLVPGDAVLYENDLPDHYP